jgi:XTP/dITP diphosphohydrolase
VTSDPVELRSAASPTKVLLATRNDAKLVELREIVSGLGVEVVGLNEVPEFPEAPETGATFAENSLAKARDACAATGMIAVADDSGLAVDALNGMPGVLSARWSGSSGDRREKDAKNLALVLDQMADVPEERRGAAFVCAAAAVHPDGREVVVTERWPGRLIRSSRGVNGFGYDPAFVPDGDSRTSAEMSPEEKNAVSHRARAFRALEPELRKLVGDDPSS